MTTDTKYNGWTNWETWVTKLHFDGSFEDTAQQCYDEATGCDTFSREENAALALMDIIKEAVQETTDELEGGKNLFIADILGGFMSSVNWHEIAAAYIDDVEKEEVAA